MSGNPKKATTMFNGEYNALFEDYIELRGCFLQEPLNKEYRDQLLLLGAAIQKYGPLPPDFPPVLKKIITAPPALPTLVASAVPTNSSELKVMADIHLFMKECCEIPYRHGMQNTEARKGPLLCTSAQRKILNLMVNRFLYKEEPVRITLLKSRQLGCTTIMLALWIWLACKFESMHIMVIIDKDKHSAEKKQMIIRWLDVIAEKYPGLPKLVKRQPHFELSNGSLIFFESAQAPNPGTSVMLHILHMSEQPKWPAGRAQQVEASIKPGVPESKYTIIINESTANGLGPFYNEFDQGTRTGSPMAIFLGWQLSSEYAQQGHWQGYSSEEVYGDNDETGFLTEQEYAEKHKLTQPQLLWRRTKIHAFKGIRALFDQEYPTTPHHAWRESAGGHFYGKSTLEALEPLSPIRGDFVSDIRIDPKCPSMDDSNVQPKFNPDPKGEFFLWEHPQKKKEYFLGGDVAQGIEVINPKGEKEADYTVFVVTDADGVICGAYISHVRPEDAWVPLLLLASYFCAWVNCERNQQGGTLLSWFILTGYRYNLVLSTPKNRKAIDRTWVLMIGKEARKQILEHSRSVVAKVGCRWDKGINQMEHFMIHPDSGKPQALTGHHDDICLALAHAHWAIAVMYGIDYAAPKEPDQAIPLPDAELIIPGVHRPAKLDDTNFMRVINGNS